MTTTAVLTTEHFETLDEEAKAILAGFVNQPIDPEFLADIVGQAKALELGFQLITPELVAGHKEVMADDELTTVQTKEVNMDTNTQPDATPLTKDERLVLDYMHTDLTSATSHRNVFTHGDWQGMLFERAEQRVEAYNHRANLKADMARFIVQLEQRLFLASMRVHDLETKLVDNAKAKSDSQVNKVVQFPLHQPGKDQRLLNTVQFLTGVGFTYSEDQKAWFAKQEGRKARITHTIKVVKTSSGYKVYLTHPAQAVRNAIGKRLMEVMDVRIQGRHLYCKVK